MLLNCTNTIHRLLHEIDSPFRIPVLDGADIAAVVEALK